MSTATAGLRELPPVGDSAPASTAVDAAWERIGARLEVVFRDIERVAANLLDRELSAA